MPATAEITPVRVCESRESVTASRANTSGGSLQVCASSESVFTPYARERGEKYIEGAGRDSHESQTRNRPPPPAQATILRHCRCQDCGHWVGRPHNECAEGIVRNGVMPVPEYPPDAWHFCALYDGPQISKDVWVWPKAAPKKKRPAPGGGGPDSRPSTAFVPAREGQHDAELYAH
jgi:hypothetical protein